MKMLITSLPARYKPVLNTLLSCFFSSTAFHSYCQDNIPTDNLHNTHIDSAIHKSVMQYFKDGRAVGLSIGIVVNGNTHFYNYGETRAGNKQLPGKQTIYEIGSITKSFTGILLAKAVLDRKISLSDDIRKYLTESYPNLVYKGVPITIQDLSNHTSRITRIFPNLWERPAYDSLNPYGGYSRMLLYEGLHRMKMDTFPGKIYSYSNMAVALLGTILEEVYKKDYFTLVFNKILQPSAMRNTCIDLSKIPADRIAWPHNEKREVAPLWDASLLPALGGLRSTTADLANYILVNNKETDPAVKLSHQRTFGTNQEGMALNWFIHSSADGYKIIEHGGGTGGSRSSLECFPQLNSGFVILTNSLANRNELERELTAIILSAATL